MLTWSRAVRILLSISAAACTQEGICGVGWGKGLQHPGPALPGRASRTQRGFFRPHLLPFGFSRDLSQL